MAHVNPGQSFGWGPLIEKCHSSVFMEYVDKSPYFLYQLKKTSLAWVEDHLLNTFSSLLLVLMR